MTGALSSLKVVDAASLFAGPVIGTLLGDFGADVIKVEHPRGDTLRAMGAQKDGVSLWWALVARNKRSLTLRLSDPRGAEALRRLLADADVLIENFRPGTLERWGLGPELLHAANPRLVIVRTTAYGQDGPYAHRPGFGTLAEALSGFAHITGDPDGPPTLPPIALADGVAALAGAFATLTALAARDMTGRGQVVDQSIVEPLFWILGPQASDYDQCGLVQSRTGNRSPFSAPRNVYRSRDGRYLALSGSSQSIAERVARLIGRADFVDEPWYADNRGRITHQDELDAAIQDWIGARHADEVIAAFDQAQAALAPVLSIADIMRDPHFRARETVTTVEHPVLGPLKMQNVISRLLDTPGRIRTLGPELGAHNEEILRGLGYDAEERDELARLSVICGPKQH